MSKSVLVIDTPSSCDKCILTYYDRYNSRCCLLTKEYINDYMDKSSYCPLSSLPDPIVLKQYVDNGMVNMYNVLYAQGYNDFRREILKGTIKWEH